MASKDNEALRIIADTANKFSVDFYKTLVADHSDNFICSPLSVSMVLSMVAFGARGNTAEEMRSALYLPDDDSVSKRGFKSLIDTLNDVKKVNLQLANKIFIAENFTVKSEFKELTANSFESEIQNLNFTNAKTACSIINAWSSAKTNGRIQQVIGPADLNLPGMVLINAVYFKGNWQEKFKPSLTSPKPFHINETTIKDVPMMHRTDEYNYRVMDDLDAIYVELPYVQEDKKDAMSMFIILPNTVNGLKKAEGNLEKIDFEQFHNHPRMTLMELYIPKFKTESSFDLQSTLTKMGMGRIFSDVADFTGIAEKLPLEISKVTQKAFIEVDEEGSEAAAVTKYVLAGCAHGAPRVQPIIVKIDRPFIYAIVHGSTNTILFQGHITLPSN